MGRGTGKGSYAEPQQKTKRRKEHSMQKAGEELILKRNRVHQNKSIPEAYVTLQKNLKIRIQRE